MRHLTSIAILLAVLAGAVRAATTPPTTTVTLLFRGPGDVEVDPSTSPAPKLKIKLSSAIRIADDDGDFWVVPDYETTITVTDPGGQTISLHPNVSGDGYTVTPASTYYEFDYKDSVGRYRGKLQVTCCGAVEFAACILDDAPNTAQDYIIGTGDSASGTITFLDGIVVAPISQPTSPTTGTIYTDTSGDVWVYTGSAWEQLNGAAASVAWGDITGSKVGQLEDPQLVLIADSGTVAGAVDTLNFDGLLTATKSVTTGTVTITESDIEAVVDLDDLQGTLAATKLSGTLANLNTALGSSIADGPHFSGSYDDLADVPASVTPTAHAASHQNGGSDELDLSGLSVAYADVTGHPTSYTPTAHASSHQDGGGDELSLAGLAVAWADLTSVPATFTPAAHASTHHTGAADAISLASLLGQLPDPQTILVEDSGAAQGAVDTIDFTGLLTATASTTEASVGLTEGDIEAVVDLEDLQGALTLPQLAGWSTSGNFLRSTGSAWASSSIQSADLPAQLVDTTDVTVSDYLSTLHLEVNGGLIDVEGGALGYRNDATGAFTAFDDLAGGSAAMSTLTDYDTAGNAINDDSGDNEVNFSDPVRVPGGSDTVSGLNFGNSNMGFWQAVGSVRVSIGTSNRVMEWASTDIYAYKRITGAYDTDNYIEIGSSIASAANTIEWTVGGSQGMALNSSGLEVTNDITTSGTLFADDIILAGGTVSDSTGTFTIDDDAEVTGTLTAGAFNSTNLTATGNVSTTGLLGPLLRPHTDLHVIVMDKETIGVTATNVTVLDSDGVAYQTGNVSLTIDITATGENGDDGSGTASATSQWIRVHVIWDKDTSTAAGLVTLQADPILPSGYDAGRPVAWAYSDSSADLVRMHKHAGFTTYEGIQWAILGGTSTSYASVDASSLVPPGVRNVLATLSMAGGTGARTLNIRETGTTNDEVYQHFSTTANLATMGWIAVDAAGSFDYKATYGAGTPSISISVRGYMEDQ